MKDVNTDAADTNRIIDNSQWISTPVIGKYSCCDWANGIVPKIDTRHDEISRLNRILLRFSAIQYIPLFLVTERCYFFRWMTFCLYIYIYIVKNTNFNQIIINNHKISVNNYERKCANVRFIIDLLLIDFIKPLYVFNLLSSKYIYIRI